METLVEPSLYVYAGNPPGSFDESSFDDYQQLVRKLDDFCDINRLRIVLTQDIRDSISRLFPFATSKQVRLPAHAYAVRAVVLRVLERHATTPHAEFVGADAWQISPALQRCGVYSDDDVWTSWLDLIFQYCAHSTKSTLSFQLLRGVPSQSCVSVDHTTLTKAPHSVAMTATHTTDTKSGFLSVDAFRSLVDKATTQPSAVWENSGHQPALAIKAALVRAARNSRCVVRVGTTYFNPSLAETCKLSNPASISEIEFRISDGNECCKGVFRTAATSIEESSVAFALLQRSFRDECMKHGFPIAQ